MPTYQMKDGTGSVKLKYLVEDMDRYGNVRRYVRVPGRRKIRLRNTPGTRDFIEEYYSALNEVSLDSKKSIRKTVTKGTFSHLCRDYYTSPEFMQLSDRTRYVRRGILDRFCDEHGDKPYASMEPRHVRQLRDQAAKRGPWAANNLLKTLRHVLNFALEYELLPQNPAAKVTLIKAPSEGHHSWTLEEVCKFEQRHPIGTQPRLALALLLYTGQRRSDVVQMTLSLPILPELQTIIDATPCGNLAFLVTSFGKPFTSNGFGNWFRKRCDEAGLRNCSAHGLRKAGAAIAAENGATERQLMAIFGWSTMQQAAHYTRAANQKRLAESGMRLLVRDQKTNKSVPLFSYSAIGGTKEGGN